jgi:hypothetical protein
MLRRKALRVLRAAAARRLAVAVRTRAVAHRVALRRQAVVKPQVATRVAAATTIPTTV